MSGLDGLLNRQPPSLLDKFIESPLSFLAKYAYHFGASPYSRPRELPDQPDSDKSISIQVICVSDTHNAHSSLVVPPGDILIHSGDLTQSGTLPELSEALNWLSSQLHPHKIFIAGNHDTCLADPALRDEVLKAHPDLVYLENSSTLVTIRGRTLRIYGSPLTPRYGSWSFQYPRISTIQDAHSSSIWSEIPLTTDVLITHGPPAFHLDLGKTGCLALLTAVWRIRPKLHVFGHIHAARGVEYVRWDELQRLYERITSGEGGWWCLLMLFSRVVFTRIVKTLWRKDAGSDATTVMVNAAVLGGMRDQEKRDPIVVVI